MIPQPYSTVIIYTHKYMKTLMHLLLLSYTQYCLGTVLGWGRDEIGNEVTDLLMEVPMPIVEKSKCIEKKYDFYPYYLNGNNFCAGYANGE